MPNNSTIGVFIGRFQPFHAGHLSIIEKILASHERMILVIGSPEKSRTHDNPWTLQEREEIIRASIPLEPQERIDIVALPDVPGDDDWCLHLKNLITNFSSNEELKIKNEKGSGSLKTENGKLKTQCFLFTGNKWVQDICIRHGIPTEWIVPTLDISSTKLRHFLRKGDDVSAYTIVKSLPLI